MKKSKNNLGVNGDGDERAAIESVRSVMREDPMQDKQARERELTRLREEYEKAKQASDEAMNALSPEDRRIAESIINAEVKAEQAQAEYEMMMMNLRRAMELKSRLPGRFQNLSESLARRLEIIPSFGKKLESKRKARERERKAFQEEIDLLICRALGKKETD